MSSSSRFILSVSLLTVLLFPQPGCSDDGQSVDPETLSISGSWRLVYSAGGFVFRVYAPPPGTVVIDLYSVRGEFSRHRNDTLLLTARYNLIHEGPQVLLHYEKAQGYVGQGPIVIHDHWVYIEGDTLRLQDPGADLYTHTYGRIR